MNFLLDIKALENYCKNELNLITNNKFSKNEFMANAFSGAFHKTLHDDRKIVKFENKK